MIKKFIYSLLNKKDETKKVLYQAATNEANRILNDCQSPSKGNISKCDYPTSGLSQMEAQLRWNKIWQKGFIQAIYDKFEGRQISNQIDYMTTYSKFSLLIHFYGPSSSIDARLENAIWELGYSSYIYYLKKGYLPF